MPIFAPQGYRVRWRGSIERGTRGKLLTGPQIFIPLSSLYPLTVGCLGGSLSHQVRHIFLVSGAACINIVSAIGGLDQVNMGIDESRQYSFAMQIYEFGVSATNAADFVVVANSQ